METTNKCAAVAEMPTYEDAKFDAAARVAAAKEQVLSPKRIADLDPAMFANVVVAQFVYFDPPGDLGIPVVASPALFTTEVTITAADLIQAIQDRDAQITAMKVSNLSKHIGSFTVDVTPTIDGVPLNELPLAELVSKWKGEQAAKAEPPKAPPSLPIVPKRIGPPRLALDFD